MIFVVLLMLASLVLVFLGLVTDVTMRMQDTSPLTHMVLTYAGLLVTLLSHMVAFGYIIGLRNLIQFGPPGGSAVGLDARSSAVLGLFLLFFFSGSAYANGGHLHLGGIFFLLFGVLAFVVGLVTVIYFLLRAAPEDIDDDDERGLD